MSNLQKVMESLEHAMKRDAPIIAEYLGGGVTCDAYHMTEPRSDGLGVSSCIQQSLQNAGVAPEEVIFFFFLVKHDEAPEEVHSTFFQSVQIIN